MKKNKIIALAYALAACTMAMAQTPQVKAELDSTGIVIGQQLGLTIEASYPKASGAVLRQLTDTLSQEVEVVRLVSSDTTNNSDFETVRQRYLVTSFDTGMHYIPPVDVLILPDSTTVATPDMVLNVLNPFQQIEVDEQSGVPRITDIKQAKDAPFMLVELLEYWPWLVLGLVVVGGAVLGTWLYRRHKRKMAGVVKKVRKPAEPPYVVALRELSRIKEEKLWQHNRCKDYYSELTDTLRRYISDRFGLSAMEKTTDEIVEDIFPVLDGDIVNKNRLQDVLTLADYVKFAKHEPLPDENDMAMKKAVDFVNGTMPTEPAIKHDDNDKTDE